MTHTSNGLARIGLIGLVLAALAIAPAAMAKTTAGNNGTVKIHDDGASETSPVTRNEPHVGCDFHMHFLFADDEPERRLADRGVVADRVQVRRGRERLVRLANGDGEAIVDGPSLSAGHYKLSWDGDTGKGPKHKVFWVKGDCGGGGGNGGGETIDQ